MSHGVVRSQPKRRIAMNARVIRSASLAAVVAAASITIAAPARAGHAYGHERGSWNPDPQPYCESAPPPCPAPTVVYGPCPPPVPVCVTPTGFTVSFSNGSGFAVSAGYASLPVGYAYQDPWSGATYVTYADWSRHFGRRHPYRVVRIVDARHHGEWHEHGRWGRD
jgi:hypothetical protein